MAEHVLAVRSVPSDWTADHEALVARCAAQGLPEPTAATVTETIVAVDDVDGVPLLVETIEGGAEVSNCAPRRPRLDHNALHCPGPGRCDAHHPRG